LFYKIIEMKKIRWNTGLLLIKLGYKVRFYDWEPKKFSIRWNVGRFILVIGYKLRGNIPQKNLLKG
jgi:hypothetical protein